MSHTNSTPNYGLPQFLTTDKPFWLTDINGAFSDIDTAIDAAKDAADDAQSDATQALSDASDANTAASGASAKADGSLASIADTYSAASTYSVGDLVIYNSLLYKNTTDIITPEAWDGSHWVRVTLEDILNTKSNSSELTKFSQDIYTANLTNPVWYEKINKIAIISCQSTLVNALSANSSMDLITITNPANLPEHISPSSVFASGSHFGMVRLDKDTGKVTLYNQTNDNIPATSAINFILTFMTA